MTSKKKYYHLKIKESTPSFDVVKKIVFFANKKGIKNPVFKSGLVGNDFIKGMITYRVWESEPVTKVFKNDTND